MRNIKQNLSAFVASTVVAASLFAVDPSPEPNESDARFARARETMASLTLAEVPDYASSFVFNTENAQRALMVRAVVEGALAKYPTSTYATVKAVLKIAPDQVKPIMEGVIAAAPKQINAALRAILENDFVSVDAAVQVIAEQAPGQLNAAKTLVSRDRAAASLPGLAAPAPPLFQGAVVVQQTTVVANPPPKRQPNDYPVGQ